MFILRRVVHMATHGQYDDAIMRFGSYFAVVGLSRIDTVRSVGFLTPVNSYVAIGHIVATAAMLFGRVRCDGIRFLGDRFKIKKYYDNPEELAKKLARDLDLVVTLDCNIRGGITVKEEREWLGKMFRFSITNRTEDALLDQALWLSSSYGISFANASTVLPMELIDNWKKQNITIRRKVHEAIERYRSNLILLLSSDAKVLTLYEGYILGPRFPKDLAGNVVRNINLMREIGELLDSIKVNGILVFKKDAYAQVENMLQLLEQSDAIVTIVDNELDVVYVVDKTLMLNTAALIFGKNDVDELTRDKRASLYLLVTAAARARFAKEVRKVSEEEARKLAFEYIAKATRKTIDEVEKDLSQLIDLVSSGVVVSRFSISVAGTLAVEEIRKKIVSALQKRQPKITDFF